MILKAVSLGISSGVFCLGFCLPVIAPLLLSRSDPTIKAAARSLALFLLGRLTAYLLAGFTIGMIGAYSPKVFFLQLRLVPISFILLGAIMVIYGALTALPHHVFCGLSARSFRSGRHFFITGFLAGINVCPPFLLALSYAFSLADVLRSVAFFFFFFLATALYMIPFLFSGVLNRYERLRSVARVAGIISGVWFISIGVGRLL